MNTSVYNLGRYTTNPFVKAGLNIILDHGPDSCPLPELAAQLVAREPLLSPRNIECAAREALRLEPQARREAEALQKAQQEEAAPRAAA
jgi:hypothetical protein